MKKFEKMDNLLQNYLNNCKTFDNRPVKEELDNLEFEKIWIWLDHYSLASWMYLQGWYDDKEKNNVYFDLDRLQLYYILKKYNMLYIYDILDAYNEYECNKKKQNKEKNLKMLKKIKTMLRKYYELKKEKFTHYFFETLNYNINVDYFINEYHSIDNWIWPLDYSI